MNSEPPSWLLARESDANKRPASVYARARARACIEASELFEDRVARPICRCVEAIDDVRCVVCRSQDRRANVNSRRNFARRGKSLALIIIVARARARDSFRDDRKIAFSSLPSINADSRLLCRLLRGAIRFAHRRSERSRRARMNSRGASTRARSASSLNANFRDIGSRDEEYTTIYESYFPV